MMSCGEGFPSETRGPAHQNAHARSSLTHAPAGLPEANSASNKSSRLALKKAPLKASSQISQGSGAMRRYSPGP